MLFNQYSEIELLKGGMSDLGMELTNLQLQQFIDYYELLTEWNTVMNLTAITEFREVVNKHFIDSLSLVKVYRPHKDKILDMGTGAGFPGIPLKIVFPEIEIVLLDSLNKRLVFLNEVISKLGLKNVVTLHGRAEDYGKDRMYRESFDVCVSRAVAKLSSLSEYCLPYVKKDGLFIPYKSGNVQVELDQSVNALKILGAKVEKVEEFQLPGTEIERSLVVIRKCFLTPKNYPRTAGKPSKEPL